MTDEERRRYEEQLQVLYQQMDERDEEIQHYANAAEQLKQQLADQVSIRFTFISRTSLSGKPHQ